MDGTGVITEPGSEPPTSSPAPATPAPSSVSGPQASAFPAPASSPTQAGPHGIRFDFNLGARVVLPAREEGSWRVRLRDLDTGNILFQSDVKGAIVSSAKRFYVRFGVEVWALDDAGAATLVLSHEYDARDREVMGESITRWLRDNPSAEVLDKVVTQSSDREFHCLTITLFYRPRT